MKLYELDKNVQSFISDVEGEVKLVGKVSQVESNLQKFTDLHAGSDHQIEKIFMSTSPGRHGGEVVANYVRICLRCMSMGAQEKVLHISNETETVAEPLKN